MGSYSMTCAFTGLAINCGDEARIILLGKDPQGLNGGPKHDFTPASGAIRCLYDDYGFVERAQSSPLTDLLAQGSGYPDAQSWLSAAEKGEWSAPQTRSKAAHLGGQIPVTFTLALEEAWQSMLAIPQQFTIDYSKHNNKISAAELICGAQREVIAWARSLNAKKAKHQAKYSQLNPGSENKRDLDYFWRMAAYDRFEDNCCATTLLGHSFWDAYHNSLAGSLNSTHVWGPISENPDAFSDERLSAIVQELGEICLAGHAMYSARKRWEPAPHGPQSGMIANQWLWARAALKMADDRFAQLASNESAGFFDENFALAQSTREKDLLIAQTPASSGAKNKKGI